MTYPPQHEVQRLWDSCTHVATDFEAWRYLRCQRSLLAMDIIPQDLARVLPRDASCPPWAGTRRQSWAESGHRLIVPVYRAWDTEPALLRAWSWSPSAKTSRLSASSCDDAYRTVKGLVMANTLGRAMLGYGEVGLSILRRAGMWTKAPTITGVVIVEGEPDYLTACCAWPGWAVLGIASGSWTDELARTIPSGAVVVIRTDDDTAGDRYAAQVEESLQGRVLALQRRTDELDVNDLLRAGRLPDDPLEATRWRRLGNI